MLGALVRLLLSVDTIETVERGVGVAERSQGILLKDLATGMIIVLLVLVVLEGVAIVWLVRMVLAFSREAVAHIERNTASNDALTEAVKAKLPRSRKPTAPGLPPEPPSQVGPPPR